MININLVFQLRQQDNEYTEIKQSVMVLNTSKYELRNFMTKPGQINPGFALKREERKGEKT